MYRPIQVLPSTPPSFSDRFTADGIADEFLIRPLSIADLDECSRVEESAFPPAERFSREAGVYRLTEFPDLCLGLFVKDASTKADAKLVGHVIATREPLDRVTEQSMSIPTGWTPASSGGGKAQAGVNAAVHSLAIHKDYQGKNLGPTLMTKYAWYLRDHVPTAERIVILAHLPLIKFYEKLGFKNHGESECQFADGGWYDMTLELRLKL